MSGGYLLKLKVSIIVIWFNCCGKGRGQKEENIKTLLVSKNFIYPYDSFMSVFAIKHTKVSYVFNGRKISTKHLFLVSLSL